MRKYSFQQCPSKQQLPLQQQQQRSASLLHHTTRRVRQRAEDTIEDGNLHGGVEVEDAMEDKDL